MIKVCPQCREQFETYRIKRAKFCSRSCFGFTRRGKQYIVFTEAVRKKIRQARKLQAPPRPKGSKLTEEHKEKLRKPLHLKAKKGGHVLIYKPDHPHCGRHKRVFEHRLVVEEVIGRYLKSNEIVHHINQVKTDNRPGNLYICSRSEHIVIHKSKKYIKVKSNLKYFQTSP